MTTSTTSATTAAQASNQVVHVPTLSYLQDDLALIAELPRAEAVQLVKEIRDREWQKLADTLHAEVFDTTGMDVALHLTAVTDGLVQALAKRVWDKAGAPRNCWERCGLFAVGGYGRGELNPYSDRDIMIVHDEGHVPEWLAFANRELQAILWDCGFDVGAAMRGCGELKHLLKTEFVTATTVLEQRMLLGSKRIAQRIDVVIEHFRQNHLVPYLQYKVGEMDERRSEAGASPFRMEPDIKTSPGHLRDIQLLRNIVFVCTGSRNIHELTEFGDISFNDINDILKTTDNILKLRHLMHFHHGKRQDEWTLIDQARIAEELGYVTTGRLAGVEILMKQHYLQVRHILLIMHEVLDDLRRTKRLGKSWRVSLQRRKINKWFRTSGARVVVRDEKVWELKGLCARLMEMFFEVQQRDLFIGMDIQRHIRERCLLLPREELNDPTAAQHFLRILQHAGQLYPVLKQMHDSGFLGAYMPEWDNITCLMQFDSYHQYTVDEHTLFMVRNLDDVINGKVTGLEPMSALLRDRLPRKDLLALSFLLHDVGKYMGRGHVARGAMMVSGVAQRLHLQPHEESLVYFLVDQHVALSDASRMRDISDPVLITQLAAAMTNRERLDYLFCLTWCDAKAVGEGVLTGWQEALLSELYASLRHELHDESDTISARDRRLRALIESGVEEELAIEYLVPWPRGYALQCSDADVVTHYELINRLTVDDYLVYADTDSIDEENAVTLHVAVVIRQRLFADLAALLSSYGCDIVETRLWQSLDGCALFHIRVEGGCVRDWQQLGKDLTAVTKGTHTVQQVVNSRRDQYRYINTDAPADSGEIEVEIKVDQSSSADNTIIDIHSKDACGLLGRLAQIIADADCQITYAAIRTMGDVAVDVFYVQHGNGKLSTEQAHSLVANLRASLV